MTKIITLTTLVMLTASQAFAQQASIPQPQTDYVQMQETTNFADHAY